MRPRSIVLLACFVVAVSACGGGSTPTAPAGSGSTAAPTAAGSPEPGGGASPAAGAAFSPCTALTLDEVRAAFVARWGGPWTVTLGNGDAINCAYEVTSPESGSDTVLVTKLDEFSWPHFVEEDGADAQPVAGLGDTAWTAGGNIQVQAGALQFRIETHDLLAPQLTTLARDILARAGG